MEEEEEPEDPVVGEEVEEVAEEEEEPVETEEAEVLGEPEAHSERSLQQGLAETEELAAPETL